MQGRHAPRKAECRLDNILIKLTGSPRPLCVGSYLNSSREGASARGEVARDSQANALAQLLLGVVGLARLRRLKAEIQHAAVRARRLPCGSVASCVNMRRQ